MLATLTGFAACALGLTQATPAAPLFPLKVSNNARYLVDQQGAPFFVVGDTPWSLIAQPTEDEIRLYLDDRHKRGFNSIIVNLLEHKFSANPPRTRSGLAPFLHPGDFSTPNPDYFDFAHDVVRQAGERGLVVWLAPAYLGYGGGDEGFFREMKAGGPEKLRVYGEFVGKRFKDLGNIIWLLGGDYTPEVADGWTVRELASAIHAQDPTHLMSAHAAPENSAASVYGGDAWLTVDTVYSYERTLFRPLLAEYAVKPARPFVLIETTYEGEHNSTPAQIRRQAYWAVLAGACGQFLGNNPIWHFDGPGLFPVKITWQQALDAQGSRDIARLATLFRQFPWEELKPEENHAVVTDGFGTDIATALTAVTDDRRLAVIYVPSTGADPRALSIDTDQFAGLPTARWFNPISGGFVPASVSPLPKGGVQKLWTPGDNGSQANDWVLILEVRQTRGRNQ